MAHREPNDPRCKDCPEPHEPGAARCAACADEHRLASKARRERLRKQRRCLVCAEPVGKRQDGKPARYCSKHLRYYAARMAE